MVPDENEKVLAKPERNLANNHVEIDKAISPRTAMYVRGFFYFTKTYFYKKSAVPEGRAHLIRI